MYDLLLLLGHRSITITGIASILLLLYHRSITITGTCIASILLLFGDLLLLLSLKLTIKIPLSDCFYI